MKANIKFKPTEFNSRYQTAIFIFILWIVAPMTSGEPLMPLLIAGWFVLTAGMAIIAFFPANFFVNLGVVPTFYAFDHLSLNLLYVIIYWFLFIALHLLTILSRKYLAYLLLSIFLITTAFSCDCRLPDLR